MRPWTGVWTAAVSALALSLVMLPRASDPEADTSQTHPRLPMPPATRGVADVQTVAPRLVASSATTSRRSRYPLGTVSLRADHVYVVFLTLSETSKSLDRTPGVTGGGTKWLRSDGGGAAAASMGMSAYWFSPDRDMPGLALRTGALSTPHEGLVHAIVEVAPGTTARSVVQHVAGRAGPAQGYTRTLPARPGADSVVVGAFAHAAAEGAHPGPGWTELPGSDLHHDAPPRGMHVIYDDSVPSQTAASTWDTPKPRRAIVVEIASDGAPVVGDLTQSASVTVVAAGDMCGGCGRTSQRAVEAGPDAVITTGDLAYTNGLLSEFWQKYGGGTEPQRRWGRPALKDITLPGYGNHDCYDVPRSTGATKQGCDDAVAYFGPDSSFGTDIPGTPGSYHTVLGDWLVVHLNSAGDMGSGKARTAELDQQAEALTQVLASDDHACEVVVWHHPWRSSGQHGNNAFTDRWFEIAHANGVDLLLSGHDHDYERFAPMDPAGASDPNGVQQFVVGSGGVAPRAFQTTVEVNSEVRIVDRGILVLELASDGYSWEFRDDETGVVDDSGTRACHP